MAIADDHSVKQTLSFSCLTIGVHREDIIILKILKKKQKLTPNPKIVKGQRRNRAEYLLTYCSTNSPEILF